MSERQTLLLVGHGVPDRPAGRHPVQAHADRLGTPAPFDAVVPGLVKGDPAFADQVRALPAGQAVVVPLFVSDGYFVSRSIPATISAHRPSGVSLASTPPVGTHPAITDVIGRHALAAAAGTLADVDLALVGHGSDHGDANRAAVETHARRLRERWDVASVSSWFLEEDPHLETLPAAVEDGGLTASTLVVVPVFVAAGTHVTDDIPAALDRTDGRGEIAGTSVACTDPVGPDPRVAGIALDRARDALVEARRQRPASMPAAPTAVERRDPS